MELNAPKTLMKEEHIIYDFEDPEEKIIHPQFVVDLLSFHLSFVNLQ